MKCYEKDGKIKNKTELYDFYTSNEINKNKIAIQVALQNSIENLVKKDLVVAYGHKTVKKWHVNNIKLTISGKKIARELIKNRQRKLPIK